MGVNEWPVGNKRQGLTYGHNRYGDGGRLLEGEFVMLCKGAPFIDVLF